MASKVAFIALAAFFALPTNAADLAVKKVSESSSYGMTEVKARPVTKVINLLKDMYAQMEHEAAVDLKIYDKIMCWCITNRKETQKNIDRLGEMLDALMEEISEMKAHSAFLTTQIAQLTADLNAAITALQEAKALREKQIDDFREAEKDLMQAIQSIRQAISVLDKHHPGDESFLQSTNPLIKRVITLCQGVLEKHDGFFGPSHREAVSALIQVSQPHSARRLAGFLQGLPNAGSYTPASGQIFGILNEMLKTFQDNLDEIREQDKKDARAYRELKNAKELEIEAINEQLKVKKVELAEVNEKLAEALKDKEAIIAAMGGDMSYLKDLKKHCKDTKAQYEQRVKMRDEEMKTVTQALAVITGDSAHDLFTRTFNPSFTQVQMKTSSDRRHQTSKVLTSLGQKLHSKALLRLATLLRLDPFFKLKDAIHKMIEQLKKEKADDIKFRDFCIESYHDNKLATQEKYRRLGVAQTDITALEAEISEIDAAIKGFKSDIETKKVEIKQLGEQRDASHKDFQQQVTDQRDTVKVLDDCLQVLKGFYGKSDTFIQTETPELPLPTPKPKIEGSSKPIPPSGFSKFKRQSTGIIGMIETIIRDTKEMEDELTKDEAEDQAAYDKSYKDMAEIIAEKEEAINEKVVVKAKKTRTLREAQKEKADMKSEIEQLGFEKKDLDNQCDFTMKNFDGRQKANDDEREALKNALSILAGSNQEAVVE